MRRIKKLRVEPRSLVEYRTSDDPNKTYDGFRDKDDLREALVADQGGLSKQFATAPRARSARVLTRISATWTKCSS